MDKNPTRQFRTVCSRFATGVTVVLAETDEGVHGMTANAFMSVSLEPLLVAVAVHRHGRMAGLLTASETTFSLSVLAQDQQRVAEFYSQPGATRTESGPVGLRRVNDQGSVVQGATAWIFARTKTVVPAGDHFLIVALVESCDVDVLASPLIFYAGNYWEHLDRERDNPIEWQLLEL